MTIDLDPRTNPARSIDGQEADAVFYPFNSWGAAMHYMAEQRPDVTWMVYLDERGGRQTWTYGEFVDLSRRVATFLRANHVQRGDRVAIAGHNHADTIMQYFACWLIGACAVPLNMQEDDDRIAFILEDSSARLVFARTEYADRIRSTAPEGVVIVMVDTDASSTGASTYATKVLSSYPHVPSPTSEDLRFEDCLIVYTSGTTGRPKGVVLLQQNLFADGFAIADWHGIDHNTRMMCVLPVHHVNGTIVTHVAPFLVGASVVLHQKFHTRRFFPSIVAEGVHIVSVVPTLLAFLLESAKQDTVRIEHTVRHIICGAGPLTVELATQFENSFQIPVIHGYGLSETTCYTCFLPLDLSQEAHRHWMTSYGFPSIGVALPCNELAIHDEHGNALAAGERGEIVVRGTNVMREYAGNATANAYALAHGWFRSGDEGFYEIADDGRRYYFITGRIKELIIRGGVNIAPLEIDEVIARAPGVHAGIAVGFEHDMYGEEVGALVVPTNDAASEADILSYCRQHLPHHKCPKVVVFANSLPVTSTGKYQRTKVKHVFAEFKHTTFKK